VIVPGLPDPGRPAHARERQAGLGARGANRPMNSRLLTGHAVDLVALDNEVSWQWVD
jgi:hypothetical protein